MQIAMVASEVTPFSKEGGLADVLGSLPAALSELGETVWVISPLYRGVRERADRMGSPLQRVPDGRFTVPIGDADVPATAWRSTLPGGGVEVFFLENDHYYDREGYYTNRSDYSDYQDNSERFVFLSRGALEMCKAVGLRPDVLHCHDWPTGLAPIYVKYIYEAEFPGTATVFTIHNIAYQGIFWHWDMNLAGLPWSLFNWKMLEYYGNRSFLKAGVVGADVLPTVSKKYGEEIQTEEQGCGMDGVLTERSEDLYGIVNGIDTDVWNPATDPLIPANFSADDLSGKALCKRALQEQYGLRQEPNVPLLGMICRLVDQKGLDLCRQALPQLLKNDLQFIALGRGEARYQTFLGRMQAEHPRSFGLRLAYDEDAAHLIEAGSDMFLMPNRFEPCGLNQLYSLKYGTVPVVRATGGLADTVVDYAAGGSGTQEANGFSFDEYTPAALMNAVVRALALYKDRNAWRQLMLTGMRQDWSWKRSAREYLDVYRKAREKAARRLAGGLEGAVA